MSELQLEQYFNNRRIIDATMRQLEKDFSLDEDSVQLKDYQGNLFEQLFEVVYPIINKLITSNYQQFLNTLYRIDVNEFKLKQEMAKVDANQYSEVVTRLVLLKELQKVIIRNIYSTKNDITN
ncbi:MAG: hypothetical protein IPG89_05695 [Bacteroidetes bacterium]|nr:hypothetical protein [Bacteroidota bacterium]